MSGDQTILSASTAADLDADVGTSLPVAFPGGQTVDLEVVGIFEDTPITQGVTLPISVLEDAGLRRNDSMLSINVAEGADVDEVHDALDAVVEDLPIVTVQDKEGFAELIKQQVNQLLFMIYGLLALAVIIAVIGIVNTLGLSVIERTREVGLLRAVGPVAATAAPDDHPGVDRHRGARRGPRPGGRAPDRGRAAPVAVGGPHRAVAAARIAGGLPGHRRRVRRARRDRPRRPRVADEGARRDRDRVARPLTQASTDVLEALGWGALAASSLVVGAVLALVRTWSATVVGLVLGFGAGALIASVSFELAEEGLRIGSAYAVAGGLALGGLTYFTADRLVERWGGRSGGSSAGAPLAVGAFLDGIPEQAVLGIGIASGQGVSAALVVAIFASNLPEAIGSAADMRSAGRSRRSVVVLWTGVAVCCALATVAGTALADAVSSDAQAFVDGFAAGALLTMLIDSMVPEAKEKAKDWAGLATVAGFALAAGLSLLGG